MGKYHPEPSSLSEAKQKPREASFLAESADCLQPSLARVRVLVGRARQQAGTLSAGLRALGAEVIEIPLIEIRPPRSYKPLDTALRQLSKYQWLILTSVNGVEALAARIEQLAIKTSSFEHLKIAAIGPSTRARAEKLGLKVAVVPPSYIAESVVDSLRDQVRDERVLLVRAKIARDVIPRELEGMGAEVDTVVAYETVIPRSSRARLRLLMRHPSQRPHVVTFTSSSTVRNFVALLAGRASAEPGEKKLALAAEVLHGISLASIGPITSSTLVDFGLRADIEAQEYTIPGLIRAIQAKLNRPQLL
jgi:uroporphyrinogen-III synthase